DLRSRGLGDVYKRQTIIETEDQAIDQQSDGNIKIRLSPEDLANLTYTSGTCLLYTSDAADEQLLVVMGGGGGGVKGGGGG
ncbi:hypothetical protein, partial [Bacillus pumilus]|uniref:hypothetical protein n=1 Tax=Bacillus pumilus TaxID=1408 RepID=UPI001C9A8084